MDNIYNLDNDVDLFSDRAGKTVSSGNPAELNSAAIKCDTRDMDMTESQKLLTK